HRRRRRGLALSKSEFLSRKEVLRRRLRLIKQIARLYKAHYWSLMERIKRDLKECYCCPVHAQAAEKYLQRALKRAGLNVPSPIKLAPKLHVVVVEYVRQIQTRRREAQRRSVSKIKIEEKTNES
ncbi:uncharacterized protein LOC120113704, partial [Hibiscus syriacus]|uniref:uncharacterized protein LOC120113704 n=1 Tax=Hibiscus syriacus TaxID=106335 RepID=UPI0019232E2E